MSAGDPSEGHASSVRILKLVPVASTYCVDTGKLVIGSAYIPPSPRVVSKDAEHIQTAFLDPRTQHEPAAWRRALAPLWRLC